MLKQGDIVTLSIHKREGVCGEVVEDFVQCSVRCIDVHNNIVYLDDNSNPIYKNTYILNLNTSINGRHTEEPTPSLDVEKWGSFKVSELFNVEKGNRLTSRDREKGEIPYVSATVENNGVEEFIKPNSNKLHDGNTISIVCYGEPSVAFYQKNPYYASDSVNILYPKFNLNTYIALFICTIFRQEKYRYNYGRGLNKERLEHLVISLPITKEGTPDWDFMEKYIKTLKYSKEL